MREYKELTQQEPYLSFLASKKSETTREAYANDLFLIRRFIGKEVHEATDSDLEAYILDCRSRKLGGATIGRYKACMGSFFKYLVVHKIKESNPSLIAREIDTGNKGRINPKALNEADRQKVLNALEWEGGIHDYQMSLAVFFGMKLGFRRFEIAKVEWSHINWDEKEIYVLGKGAKECVVNIPKSLFEKLQDYKMLVDKAGIDSRWLFFRNKCWGWELDANRHVTNETVASWFKIIGKRAGVKWSSHVGRHIFCTTLNEKGVADLTAIQMSRHESVEMFKRYSKIEKKKIKSELNRAID